MESSLWPVLYSLWADPVRAGISLSCGKGLKTFQHGIEKTTTSLDSLNNLPVTLRFQAPTQRIIFSVKNDSYRIQHPCQAVTRLITLFSKEAKHLATPGFFCSSPLSPSPTRSNKKMASPWLHLLLLVSFLSMNLLVKCDTDEEDTLLQGLNSYRESLNLTSLTKNKNAECLADELADQFKNQPCTNSTGANTVPGTEKQLSNYPDLLAKCHLNVSNTRDGIVMPACVPNLEPSLVLSNFTKSQYSDSLNDTKYKGAGIGSEDNWIVVILTTSTPEGSYVPYNAASLFSNIGLIYCLLFWLISALMIF
ncbi:putative GPI-anchored protein [Citrus sinensis]|nr:putative GPI-anchored protein [Citrus sinensis]